jgi:LacI family transcriptional regulator
MKRKITIVDIANKLGITPSAVSKAFSDHPRISVATKKNVLEAAKVLGYQRNAMATGLRNGKSGLIGVLVPGIHYSFFAAAIKGAEEILSDHGYGVIIAQSRDGFEFEKRQLEGFVKAQVEGIIASLAAETKEYDHYKALVRDTPLVLFDRTFDDDRISTVTIDDFSGAVKAVDHLVEMGYRKIAHIAGYQHVQPFGKRIDGYKFALSKHGLSVREDYIFQCAPNKDEGAEVTRVLLGMTEPPDAIFAASDYLALGAIRAIKERGLHIPDQIGIVGFSNEEFSSQVSPSITTIDQFSESLGSVAATSLIDQLKVNATGQVFVARRDILSPKLIVRSSSHKNVSEIIPNTIL